MDKLEALGKRICIIGATSSGKSTLAQKLSNKLNIKKLVHLDIIAHYPNSNWQRTPIEDFIIKHNENLKYEEWIIEGNYSVCMSNRFKESTAIIWLDYNPFYCVYNFIKRCFQDSSKRIGEVEGAPEKINIKRIKHTLFQYPKNRHKYKEIISNFSDTPVIYINSMKELSLFCKRLDL